MRISDWSSDVCSSDLGDVGLGRDQLQESRHRQLGVQQALVHVDVDDLRARFHLLARDLDGGGIIARHDQLLEPRRSGDVGAFSDIDEPRSEENTSELQSLMRILYAVFCFKQKNINTK